MNSKKNIQIISKYISTKSNGFETRIFTIAKILVKRGYSVTVITSNSNHLAHFETMNRLFKVQEIEGVRVVWINTLKYNKSISLKRVLSWLDFEFKLFFLLLFSKIKIKGITIISSLSLLSILNALLFKSRNSKIIFEIRDIWPLTLVEEGGYSKSNLAVKFLGFVERIGYIKSDFIVGTMPNLKSHVDSIVGKNKTMVGFVPFGYKEEKNVIIKENTSKIEQIKNLTKDKFVLCYSGSISLTNGLNSLIETIKLYDQKNITDVFFLIVGDGLMSLNYKNQLNNCNNVFFTGKVARDLVPSYLNLANLLYFSSLPSKVWDYGWSPNKIIEYMSSGKPVLAAYDGYRSMVNEANSGFFIKSNNINELDLAIQKIKNIKRSILIDMGSNGKKWLIKNRSWESITDSYEEIFLQLT